MTLAQTWGSAAPETDVEPDPVSSSLGDISCAPDLDPSFSVKDGQDALSEAVLRRLSTPRGSLFYDLDYGLDLRALLNESLRVGDLDRIAAAIEGELVKDERIIEAFAEVEYEATKMKLTIRIEIGSAAGPFRLSLAVDRLEASILRRE